MIMITRRSASSCLPFSTSQFKYYIFYPKLWPHFKWGRHNMSSCSTHSYQLSTWDPLLLYAYPHSRYYVFKNIKLAIIWEIVVSFCRKKPYQLTMSQTIHTPVENFLCPYKHPLLNWSKKNLILSTPVNKWSVSQNFGKNSTKSLFLAPWIHRKWNFRKSNILIKFSRFSLLPNSYDF